MLVMFEQANQSYAIDNTPGWSLIEFNFTPPGARAMGMGGAFVGLADDATSAVVNPAGLVQLPNSQFVIEGEAEKIDTEKKLWYENQKVEVGPEGSSGLSFFSLSMPIFDNRASISMNYNKVASINSTMNIPPFDPGTGDNYISKTDLSIDEFGIV